MFDYALLDRPMVFHLPDEADLGTGYFDLARYAPGPITRTEDELVAALAGFDAGGAAHATAAATSSGGSASTTGAPPPAPWWTGTSQNGALLNGTFLEGANVAVPRDVFIVCNNTDAMGGLQRWAHHLAGLLASRGAKVTLVGVTHAPERHRHQRGGSYSVVALHDAWHPPALAWRPGSVRQRMNVRARARDLWRTAAMRQGAARLSSLFGAARPGAVVIVAQVWAMEWVRHADTTGLKIVGMSHESYRATRRSTRYARVREHYACADRFLALTAEDADAWARAGMSNADHMPNPLHVLPGPAAPLDAPVVACVGRLAHEKGVDLLLEAWEEVAARHPRWRLRVYGDGPEEAALIDRAEAAGLGARSSSAV